MGLDDFALFVAVVDGGSFTAGAKRLGISKSAASKRLTALEARLGTRLLERTTRALRLTDAGRRYHQRAREIVDAAEAAELEVRHRQHAAVGRLRVSAPVSFGTRFLGPAIADFTLSHPEVTVDIALDDRFVDLIEDDFDVAIRAGALADSSLVARPLVASRSLVVASPDYLEQHGRPVVPRDLAEHEVLLYQHQITGRTWQFEGAGGRRSVRVRGRLESNNGDILAEAACAGVGVALLPDFIVQPHLQSGRLEALMEPWCRAESAIHAVYPNRHLSTKVRLFVEVVADHLTGADARMKSPG